jgi:hypothetical protein
MTKTRAPKTRAFLAAIREMPHVRGAARAAGVSPFVHYRRLKSDPRYKDAFERAWECGCQALEDKATERAIEGWDEPVYQGGGLVGTKRKFSDRCLLARLEAEMPEKYRKNLHVDADVNVNLPERLLAARKRVTPPPDDESGTS